MSRCWNLLTPLAFISLTDLGWVNIRTRHLCHVVAWVGNSVLANQNCGDFFSTSLTKERMEIIREDCSIF